MTAEGTKSAGGSIVRRADVETALESTADISWQHHAVGLILKKIFVAENKIVQLCDITTSFMGGSTYDY